MCNAWNHPPDCSCGWGGDGHSGSFGGSTSYSGGGSSDGRGGGSAFRTTFEGEVFHFPFVTYPSYVNPNARCPVCGAEVYFYQSPYGGKVFFDDLGPPWPKHPCTNSPIIRQHFSSAESRTQVPISSVDAKAKPNSQTNEHERPGAVDSTMPVEPARLVAWVAEGWMPFIVSRVTNRRVGIEAEGTLYISAKEPLSFRIVQTSHDARFYRKQGQLQIGFSLIQNSGPVLRVLNECPILLKKDQDLEHLILSTFILTGNTEVEEITFAVDGQILTDSKQATVMP